MGSTTTKSRKDENSQACASSRIKVSNPVTGEAVESDEVSVWEEAFLLLRN
jgi:hypothetical protein